MRSSRPDHQDSRNLYDSGAEVKKGQTVYLIDIHGNDVLEREFLREDDLFVYTRRRGESGRGSSHPKLFAFESKAAAYNESANRLEDRARDHRNSAKDE